MEPRDLPRVDDLAERIATTHDLPRLLAIGLARDAIASAREMVIAGREADPAAIADAAAIRMSGLRPRRLINATGVLLHTNMGRAVLAHEAVAAAAEQASGYGNVEFDPGTGSRTRRGAHVRNLLCALTGAEDALVVNNNAGALVLALGALAGGGGRVAVSRGELIEIGGSFRLPEVIEAGGVRLVEIGTTNRTRVSDYERAVGHVDVLLKVHPSNYRVAGFTEEASWEDVGNLSAGIGKPLVADVGSGLLDEATPWLDHPPPWLSGEPGVRQTLAAGAAVVLFSGDKLLGGPQAGIAVGSAPAIARMAAHPFARAMRCDGPTLAALAVTLELYAGGRAMEVPFWRMATIPIDELRARCESVVAHSGVGSVVDGTSVVGGGSVPGSVIETPVIELDESSHATLLAADPPIVGTQREGAARVNLRTVDPGDDEHIATTLAR